jgi:hypothetical protein
VAMQTTDEDIISRVAALFGVKYHAYQRRNVKCKTAYIINVRGSSAYHFMQALYPILGQRRRGQITNALADYVYKPDRRGSNNSFSKLQEADVKEIKRRLASGEVQRVIARDYNISPRAVSDIKCGLTWGHVTPDEHARGE